MLPVLAITIFSRKNGAGPARHSRSQSAEANKAIRARPLQAPTRIQKVRFSKREYERLCYGGKVIKKGFTYWSPGAQFDWSADSELDKYVRLTAKDLKRDSKPIGRTSK
jgi:hypothetical protein